MSLDESDSQVNVNCVFDGEVAFWSRRLTLLGPLGSGEVAAAALAIAVEMMPGSDLLRESSETPEVRQTDDIKKF